MTTKNPKRDQLQPSLYDQLRTQLDTERSELRSLIQKTEQQLMELASENADILGDVGSDQESLIEKSCRYRERLRALNETFGRIRDGSFGRCALCEEPIARKRLEALPTARYCRDCQEQMERCEQPQGEHVLFNFRRGLPGAR